MATRAQVLANINNKISEANLGRLIIDSDLRESLATDVDSILENLYPENIQDTELSTNVVTAESGKTYELNFRKVGTNVVVNGVVKFTARDGDPAFICEVTNTEFLPLGDHYGVAYNIFTNELMPIRLSELSKKITLDTTAFNVEAFRISLIYTTNR
jgi:hypothetical protein